MRGMLSMLRERTRRAALLLSVLATALALVALGLAAYAVYHVLSTRQDVWLSYSPADPGIALAPMLAIVAAVVVLAGAARSLKKA